MKLNVELQESERKKRIKQIIKLSLAAIFFFPILTVIGYFVFLNKLGFLEKMSSDFVIGSTILLILLPGIIVVKELIRYRKKR